MNRERYLFIVQIKYMHVSCRLRRLVGTAADLVRQWSPWGAENAGVDNAASSNYQGRNQDLKLGNVK